MSLSQKLLETIEKTVQSYAENIAEKYNLDVNELLSIWSDGQSRSQPKAKPKTELSSVDMDDLSLERLHKCNKAELAALCKSKGHKSTGKKDELIERLTGSKQEKVEKKSEPKVATTSSVSKKEVNNSVVKKLTADVPVIPVRKNKYGNFEHPESGLVFDRKTETVFGKQQEDGTISELTDDDIESCKRFKFKYKMPDNLDKKENLDNVKIKQLDDDGSDIEVVEESGDEQEEDEDVEVDEEEEEDEDEIVDDD